MDSLAIQPPCRREASDDAFRRTQSTSTQYIPLFISRLRAMPAVRELHVTVHGEVRITRKHGMPRSRAWTVAWATWSCVKHAWETCL